ncbi:hypothetical protein [Prosthecobacter sp.]|uniref:hypothetical protein n=1 Tax=Prosthecobacter sp. TaxID=1965333 RepID=UPI003784B3A8
MSKALPPNTTPATDENEDQEGLLFARCKAPAESSGETTEKDTGDRKKKSKQSTKEGITAKVAGQDQPPSSEMDSNQPNPLSAYLTRSPLVVSLCTSLAIGLLLFIAARSFYVSKIEPRLASGGGAGAASASGAAGATEEALREQLARSAEQITALQKQVDVMRREQLLTQQNTRESLEKISTALKNPQLAPAPVAVSAEQAGASRIAEMKMEVSPTQQEFIQLKERNRLTQYADEAIATGERKPLELLVEYMRDPQQEHLHAAAQAEFMRALRAIQLLQRDDPGYRLPVKEMFKDSGISDEADVKPEVLLKLLADYKQPWEVRVRVCFLLLGSPLPETNAQLIKSIKEDPSLEVAKHAQLALEQRIKKRFRIFDIPAIEAWFKDGEK